MYHFYHATFTKQQRLTRIYIAFILDRDHKSSRNNFKCTRGFAQFLCKYYAILEKRPEDAQILTTMG